MTQNLVYRMLLVVTVICDLLILCSAPTSSFGAWIICVIVFFGLSIACINVFKKLPKEKINEILMIDTFKKYGFNMEEE